MHPSHQIRRRRSLTPLTLGAFAVGAAISLPGAHAQTAMPRPVAAEPTVHGYTFPAGMVDGRAGGGKVFSRMEGVIALPAGPGPHPVVVIVHGSYPMCVWAGHDRIITGNANTVRWPFGCGTRRVSRGGLSEGPDYHRATAGMGYIARALARRGMVAVAVDVGTKELWWTGEPLADRVQSGLVAAHLRVLRDLNSGVGHGLPWAGEATGRLDLSRLALVGHSSGAGWALSASARRTLPGLAGVVAIEPAINTPPSGRAVPTMIVAGACDEQVGVAGPLRASVRLGRANPATPVLSAHMMHTTHIGLLAGGGTHRIGLVRPVESAGCRGRALPPAATMQRQAAGLTADFLADAFAGGSRFTFGIGAGWDVRIRSRNAAASTAIVPDAPLPGTLAPKDIGFDASADRVLPPLPKGVTLLRTPPGGGV